LVFFKALLSLVSLGFDTGEFLAQIAILIAALPGFVFPLLSTLFDFGELAHVRRPFTNPAR
jgi:hypothetical protein